MHAQAPLHRVALNPLLAPFYHGVASGDPLSDRVIIWTRITPTVMQGPVAVEWEMATDTSFATIVASGDTTTDETRDYTVKVDVMGLQPGTWYYYRFASNGQPSIMGRTRTLPVGNTSRVRLAITSCSDYQDGYFNAYELLTDRNDLDLVLHLGDYIYEYGANSALGRNHEPATEILSLSDYRARYSQYRMDPDLMYAHQQYPFIVVWDDHESANNSWRDGANNHTEGAEGTWVGRLGISVQVYDEWMPIRLPDPQEPRRIYRQFEFGTLANLSMLDTRIIGRDEQAGNTDIATMNDPSRTLLGADQFSWFTNQLKTSQAQWKLVGQQVMFGPLGFTNPLNQQFQPLNSDQWDGYAPERRRILDTLVAHNINDMVVLTGDVHTSWANDVPLDRTQYSAATGAGSRAVEFVTTSVTSENADVSLPSGVITAVNPWVKYVELSLHGFVLLDVDTTRAQADFYFVSTVDNLAYTAVWEESWYTNTGTNRLQKASSASLSPANLPIHAPRPKDSVLVSATELAKPVMVAAYPNPFQDIVELQYIVYKESPELNLQVMDMQGRVLATENLGRKAPGLHILPLHLGNLPAGNYLLRLATPQGQVFTQRLVKFN